MTKLGVTCVKLHFTVQIRPLHADRVVAWKYTENHENTHKKWRNVQHTQKPCYLRGVWTLQRCRRFRRGSSLRQSPSTRCPCCEDRPRNHDTPAKNQEITYFFALIWKFILILKLQFTKSYLIRWTYQCNFKSSTIRWRVFVYIYIPRDLPERSRALSSWYFWLLPLKLPANSSFLLRIRVLMFLLRSRPQLPFPESGSAQNIK